MFMTQKRRCLCGLRLLLLFRVVLKLGCLCMEVEIYLLSFSKILS